MSRSSRRSRATASRSASTCASSRSPASRYAAVDVFRRAMARSRSAFSSVSAPTSGAANGSGSSVEPPSPPRFFPPDFFFLPAIDASANAKGAWRPEGRGGRMRATSWCRKRVVSGGVQNTRVCEHELVDDALFLLYPFAGASRRRLVAARTARRAAPAARPKRARLTTDTHLRARPPLPSTHDGRDRELRDGDARTPPLLGHRSVARRAQARRRREGAQGTRRSDVSRRSPFPQRLDRALALSLLPHRARARSIGSVPARSAPARPTPRARSKGKG